jgi:hypothetical protein
MAPASGIQAPRNGASALGAVPTPPSAIVAHHTFFALRWTRGGAPTRPLPPTWRGRADCGDVDSASGPGSYAPTIPRPGLESSAVRASIDQGAGFTRAGCPANALGQIPEHARADHYDRAFCSGRCRRAPQSLPIWVGSTRVLRVDRATAPTIRTFDRANRQASTSFSFRRQDRDSNAR